MAYDVNGQIKGNIVNNATPLAIRNAKGKTVTLDDLIEAAELIYKLHAHCEQMDIPALKTLNQRLLSPVDELISKLQSVTNVDQLVAFNNQFNLDLAGLHGEDKEKMKQAYELKQKELS